MTLRNMRQHGMTRLERSWCRLARARVRRRHRRAAAVVLWTLAGAARLPMQHLFTFYDEPIAASQSRKDHRPVRHSLRQKASQFLRRVDFLSRAYVGNKRNSACRFPVNSHQFAPSTFTIEQKGGPMVEDWTCRRNSYFSPCSARASSSS
jgi:hypothetical protein